MDWFLVSTGVFIHVLLSKKMDKIVSVFLINLAFCGLCLSAKFGLLSKVEHSSIVVFLSFAAILVSGVILVLFIAQRASRK